MRHGKKSKSLGRKAAHRNAMLSNMACSLIEHKRINTTVAKAKALRGYIEPLITKSKTDSTHSRRVVFKYLQSKNATTELFREVAPKVANRPGGYLRIIRIGNRLGDNAEMCMVELVDFNELMTKEPKEKKTRRSRRGKGGSSQKAAEKKTENKSEDTSTAKEEKPKANKEAKGDDLTQIKGIGPVHAEELSKAGFTTFDQLASLTAKDIEKIDAIEGISAEMIETEEWKEQATILNNYKKLLNNLGTAKASDKDDLTVITGIGEVLEKELNGIGVYTYEQVSKILVKDMEYLSGLSGVTRNVIESEEWVKQAKAELKKKKNNKEEK